MRNWNISITKPPGTCQTFVLSFWIRYWYICDLKLLLSSVIAMHLKYHTGACLTDSNTDRKCIQDLPFFESKHFHAREDVDKPCEITRYDINRPAEQIEHLIDRFFLWDAGYTLGGLQLPYRGSSVGGLVEVLDYAGNSSTTSGAVPRYFVEDVKEEGFEEVIYGRGHSRNNKLRLLYSIILRCSCHDGVQWEVNVLGIP